jgi:hypothetical protein
MNSHIVYFDGKERGEFRFCGNNYRSSYTAARNHAKELRLWSPECEIEIVLVERRVVWEEPTVDTLSQVNEPGDPSVQKIPS